MEFLPDSGEYRRGLGGIMTRRLRRNRTPVFKAKVALAAIKGERTLADWRSYSSLIRTRSRVERATA